MIVMVTVNKSFAFGFDTALGLVRFWTVRDTHPFPEGAGGQGVAAKRGRTGSNEKANAAIAIIFKSLDLIISIPKSSIC